MLKCSSWTQSYNCSMYLQPKGSFYMHYGASPVSGFQCLKGTMCRQRSVPRPGRLLYAPHCQDFPITVAPPVWVLRHMLCCRESWKRKFMSLEQCPLALISSNLLNMRKQGWGQSPRGPVCTKDISQQNCAESTMLTRSHGDIIKATLRCCLHLPRALQ